MSTYGAIVFVGTGQIVLEKYANCQVTHLRKVNQYYYWLLMKINNTNITTVSEQLDNYTLVSTTIKSR